MKKITKYSKIISANWKMNGSLDLVGKYKRYLYNKKNFIKHDKSLIICPPYPYIPLLTEISKNYKNVFTGAQNCSSEVLTSRTGDISASIIKNVGSSFVILGHSERRSIYNEANKIISKKIDIALKAKLITIVCIGETLEEKKYKKTKYVIRNQLEKSLINLCNPENTIIAYEPVWAIGSGKIPSLNEIENINNYIHKILESKFSIKRKSKKFKILYGGSVNSKNSKILLESKLIDGVLLGGSSLNIVELHKIINFDAN